MAGAQARKHAFARDVSGIHTLSIAQQKTGMAESKLV
jgi:hypothetical protein